MKINLLNFFSMKALKIIGAILFIIGITFKFVHWPFASIIFIVGTLLMFVHGLIFLFQKMKQNSTNAWVTFTFSLFAIYILFRFQYWPAGPRIIGFPLLFIIVFGFSVFSLFKIFQSKFQSKIQSFFFLIAFSFFMILSYVHSYSIFYLVNLNSVTNGSTRELNYHAWDRYSWFLYIADRKGDAIDANVQAKKAAKFVANNYGEYEAALYLKEIKKHGILIEKGTWK